jgi:hypothetical protein
MPHHPGHSAGCAMTIYKMKITVTDTRSHNVKQYFAIANRIHFQFLDGDGCMGLVKNGRFQNIYSLISLSKCF